MMAIRGDRLRLYAIPGIVIVFLVGCRSSDSVKEQRSTPFQKYVSVTLVADKIPSFMGTAKITCEYSINYPADRSDTLTWYVSGYFRDPAPSFSILSGDSCWVDTVASYTRVEHTIKVRAIERGQFIVEAFVYTPLDSNHVLGDNATISLDVQ